METTPEDKLMALLERYPEVKALPCVSRDDLNAAERENDGAQRDTNNIHDLFTDMMKERKGVNLDPRTRLQRIRTFGAKWENFLLQNRELIEDIIILEEIAEKVRSFKNLCFRLMDRSNPFELTIVDKVFNSDLGVEGVAIPIWRLLDPLLVLVLEKMREAGIPTAEFDG